MIRPFIPVLLLLSFSAQAENTMDLQWAVCDPRAEDTASIFGIDSKAKAGSITYYDTIPVSFLDQGITFRTKEKNGERTSSVKVRFHNRGFNTGDHCEWDAYGTEETYTCEVTKIDVSESDPWSNRQKDFVESITKIHFDSLHSFGPYPTLSWKTNFLSQKLHLDSVNLPNGMAPLIEISVKVPYSQKDLIRDRITEELRNRGVQLCPQQASKTMRLFRQLGLKH